MSLENKEYKPLPNVGDTLKNGDEYAKIKILNTENNIENINIQPSKYTVSHDCEIISVNIYANSWNKKIHEFNKFISGKKLERENDIQRIKEQLIQYMDKSVIKEFMEENNLIDFNDDKLTSYSRKGNVFNGVFIEIKALYKESLDVGDKIANRHGNKGIIAKVISDKEMPTLEDGRKLDVIINPLGIISRMNVGQLYELHLTEAFYHLHWILVKY